LTALKALLRGKHPGRQSFLPVVAVLCVALLAFLAVAQVAHVHSSGADADHCQLCIAMHTAVPVAAAVTAIVLVQLGASAPAAEPILIARQRYSRLFIRPPPISC
jgi:hypothetical protein